MTRSLVSFPGRRRLANALGVGVLAGSLALAGCSSGSPKGGGTIPPLSTAGAGGGSTASAPAAGGTSTGASGAASAGAVTAESLSDSSLGYTVVSIPDGLDATKTKILQDYVAYDKATWRLWSTRQGYDSTSQPVHHFCSVLHSLEDNVVWLSASQTSDSPSTKPMRYSILF